MKEIIPALMPKNFSNLKELLERVKQHVSTVQIDVMDGKFVQAKSWPMIRENDEDFIRIVKQDEGFPYWEDVNFEADLMVTNPQVEADRWAAAGALRIIVHFLSAPRDTIIATLKDLKSKGVEAGIAFTYKTTIEDVVAFVTEQRDSIDFVQLMGIKNIGHQGEPFDETVIDRVKTLKEKFSDLTITIDGGVNYDTAQDLLAAGVDRLVSGSAILQADSLEDAILDFKDLVEGKVEHTDSAE
ncbi:MAG: hypothetical protein RL094_274 [Candidatus Parcubacteria bacterium]|jgi:ribulose-phosphate 3-epimerase